MVDYEISLGSKESYLDSDKEISDDFCSNYNISEKRTAGKKKKFRKKKHAANHSIAKKQELKKALLWRMLQDFHDCIPLLAGTKQNF